MMSGKPDDLITAQEAAELLGRSRRRADQGVPAVDSAPKAGGIHSFNEERITEDEATATTDRERKEAAAKRQITSRHRRPSPGAHGRSWSRTAAKDAASTERVSRSALLPRTSMIAQNRGPLLVC
ncbi:hypothetical protein AB0393_39450, partial [Streptomyces cyaneofuscatus]|uniref:hypothetical protein n=1 Tax=Streptomyces cyaneofuscatus TaxID=66883 RepID=UPI00344DBB6F